jgi:3-oxoacyl-[acyl-carrier-protein] synthase II
MRADDADDVVITGLGIVSPVGPDARSTMRALLAGESGVRLLPADERERTPVSLCAPVDDSALTRVSRRERLRHDRSVQLALQAGREAWEDAGAPQAEPSRVASVIATGMGGLTILLGLYDRYLVRGPVAVPAHTITGIMANASSALLAAEIGARAAAVSLASACASGSDAIAHALRLFRDDEVDLALAGGTEAIVHPVTLSAFAALRALSSRHDDPARASRPFDRDRDGFVLGEGAAVLVLERRRHARARGARIWARVAGAGSTCDGSHLVAPDPTGQWNAAAIGKALRAARLGPSDVHAVSAHATATVRGDLAEAEALKKAFNDALGGVCVTALKSSFGHMIGASGAVAAAVAAISVRDKALPPTRNLDHLDPAIDLDVVRDKARPLPAGAAIVVNAAGFGGHNTALVIAAE